MTRDSGAKTREALMASAVTLFADRGFEATSVQAIVDGACATKGAFYHHFAGKHAVLLAIHVRFVQEQIETLQSIADRGLPSTACLRAMVEALIAEQDVRRFEIAVFNQERDVLHRGDFEHVRALRRRVEDIISEVILRGIEQEELRPVPSVRLVVFGLQGMAAWVYRWYRPTGAMSAREIGRIYASMLLHGIRTPEPSDEEPSPYPL